MLESFTIMWAGVAVAVVALIAIVIAVIGMISKQSEREEQEKAEKLKRDLVNKDLGLASRANLIRNNSLLQHNHRRLLSRLSIDIEDILDDEWYYDGLCLDDFLEIVAMIEFWNYTMGEDLFDIPTNADYESHYVQEPEMEVPGTEEIETNEQDEREPVLQTVGAEGEESSFESDSSESDSEPIELENVSDSSTDSPNTPASEEVPSPCTEPVHGQTSSPAPTFERAPDPAPAYEPPPSPAPSYSPPPSSAPSYSEPDYGGGSSSSSSSDSGSSYDSGGGDCGGD